MAISVSTITILGTAYPWEIGGSTPNTGTAGTIVPYNTADCDGSATAGATTGQNAAYLYGKLHAHSGETGPTLIAVSPGNIVVLEYQSGFVQSGAPGAGDSGPSGSPTTGLAPLPAGGCDGETMASNVVPGYTNINTTGTVNTSGTAVTWVSGPVFKNGMVGNPFWINNVKYFVSAVTSKTTLTLTTTAGTQTAVTYLFWGAQTAVGGLIGAFVDSSGNILSTFDFGSWVGTLTFAVSSIAETAGFVVTLTGVFASSTHYYVGQSVFITGLTQGTWLNSQTVTLTAVTGTTLTFNDPTNHGLLSNIASVGNALGGTANLTAPANASHLSLGINDTQLYDNTGHFSFIAMVIDSSGWVGSAYPFKHFPAGLSGYAFSPDTQTGMVRFAEVVPSPQIPGNALNRMVGQLFPRGAQNTGGSVPGVGQNFPY